jgi:NADPH2:quinone reductase
VAINRRTQDFATEVQRLTDGKGAEVIIESVAADNLAKDFTAVAPGGRIVLIGSGTGKPPEATFNVGTALRKDAAIYAMVVFNARALIPEMADALTRLFIAGKIKSVVSKTYPLPEAALALNHLLAGKVIGKLVLIP